MSLKVFHNLTMFEREILLDVLELAEQLPFRNKEHKKNIQKTAKRLHTEILQFPVLIEVTDDPGSDWYKEGDKY